MGSAVRSRLPAWSRALHGRGARSLAALALAVWLLPGLPLERSAWLRSFVERAATDAGARVEIGRVRIARVPWRGLALHDLVVRDGEARFRTPRAHLSLSLAALLRGALQPRLSARTFRLDLPDAGGAGALAWLRAGVAPLPPLPDLALTLRNGVILSEGERVLTGVRLDASSAPERTTLEARAHQPGGGRVELRLRRDPLRGLRLELFPSRLRVAPERELVALGFEVGRSAPLFASGHWIVHAEPGAARVHDIELALHDGPLARREAGTSEAPARGEDDGGGLALRVAGRVATAGGRFAPGSTLAVSGTLRHGAAGGLWVAGPARGRLALTGPTHAPTLEAELELDDARVHATAWLRKPAGTRARLALSAAPAAPTRARLELGALRAQAELGPEGSWLGSTDWLEADALGALVPALESHVTAGRLRLPVFALSPSGDFASAFAAESVVFVLDEEVPPLRLDGSGRLDESGLVASELVGTFGELAFELDLAVRPEQDRLAARFDARVGRWQLPGRAPDARPAGTPSGDVPASLVVAAEAPLAWLRDELARFARLDLERSRLRVAALRGPGTRLDAVDLELAMRDGRLALPRLAWHEQGRARLLTGAIDLNPLIPSIELKTLR